MEPQLRPQRDSIRISTSPGRSPQITEALTSPARSVHPQMQRLDSIHTQPDFGLRTTDFFDDTSDDESAKAINVHSAEPDDYLLEPRGSVNLRRQSVPPDEPFASQCESKRPSSTIRPDTEGYQRLTPTITNESHHRARTPSSSLVGSVDELLPGGGNSPLPQFPERARISSGRKARDSAEMNRSQKRASSKIDHTLLAYEIAHGITLQALMRDESFPLAPLQAANRLSLLPTSLHDRDDPRSPRYRPLSMPPSAEYKKVHVVPPPIDTTAARHSLPEDIVRTPYPLETKSPRGKHFNNISIPTSAGTRVSSTESVLPLSIRQTNPNSRRRVTTLTIPASNDYSAVRTHIPRLKEQHFKPLDFDDADFFAELRKSYRELVGPIRLLSARSLRRIVVSGQAMKEADRGYWIHQPRSPRLLAYKGLSDSFSEERILQHYRRPLLGKSRYAFVHWAHRLAATPPVRTPRPDDDLTESSGRDHPEGLEFVMCWSIPRISVALLLILAGSSAAALLWIFLGRFTPASWPAHGGYHDAGDRIVSGVVMGICILLLGLSGIIGWLGISWLVM